MTDNDASSAVVSTSQFFQGVLLSSYSALIKHVSKKTETMVTWLSCLLSAFPR